MDKAVRVSARCGAADSKLDSVGPDSYPTGMEWPEKANRPGDGGTMGAAIVKVGDFIDGAGKVSVSLALG